MRNVLNGTQSFRGWAIVGAAMVIMAVVGGFGYYAPSVYLVPLQDFFNVNRTAISLGSSFTSLFAGIAAPLVGIFVDRFGPRRAIILGIAGLIIGFLALSRMQLLWHYYALTAFQGLALPFTGLIPHQALIGLWFVRRRGRAMGITMAGLGLDGLLFPWINGLVIEHLGWRPAYLIGAAAFAAVPLTVAWGLLSDRPEDTGQHPDGAPAQIIQSDSPAAGVTLPVAVRSLAFWGMALAMVLYAINNGILTLQLPAMMQGVGMSLDQAGGLLGLMLGVSVIGRLGAGQLTDHLDARKVFAIMMTCMGLGALPLLAPANPFLRAVFILIYGIAQGGAATTIPLTVQSLFGMKAFGKIYGWIVVGMTLGFSIGNFLGGRIYDWQGDYMVAVSVAGAAGLLAGCLSLTLRRPQAMRQEAK